MSFKVSKSGSGRKVLDVRASSPAATEPGKIEVHRE